MPDKKKLFIKVCIGNFLLAMSIIFISFEERCFAYIDPGTGSMVLQVIIGMIFGSLLFLKMYFKKIKKFFSHLFFWTKKEKEAKDEPGC